MSEKKFVRACDYINKNFPFIMAQTTRNPWCATFIFVPYFTFRSGIENYFMTNISTTSLFFFNGLEVGGRKYVSLCVTEVLSCFMCSVTVASLNNNKRNLDIKRLCTFFILFLLLKFFKLLRVTSAKYAALCKAIY